MNKTKHEINIGLGDTLVVNFTTEKPKKLVAGYVVRYSRGVSLLVPSKPLHKKEGNTGLWIGDQTTEQGALFLSHAAAVDAAAGSEQYQRENGYHWNAMYGPYIIDPVYID